LFFKCFGDVKAGLFLLGLGVSLECPSVKIFEVAFLFWFPLLALLVLDDHP